MSARQESSLDVEPEYLTSTEAAARAGIKVKSLYALISRGHAPEPDLTWLGRSLWLVSTIDAWRSERYTRRKTPRVARRYKRPTTGKPPKAPKRRLPPKLVNGERLAPEPPRRPPKPVPEPLARQAAAALRSEGFHCTTEDVLELAVADGKGLGRERALLQRRVLASVQALRRAERAAGEASP